MCGSAYLTGTPDQPIRASVAWVDCGTASLAAFGTLAALMAREKTGRGQKVEGALLRTAVAFNNPTLVEQQVDPGQPRGHAEPRPDLGAVGHLPHEGRLDHRLRHRQPDVRPLGEAHGRGPLAHRSALQGRRGARRPRRDHLQAHGRVERRAHDVGGALGARGREDPGGAALLAAAGARGHAHPRGRPPPRHRLSRAAAPGPARADAGRSVGDAGALPPPRPDARRAHRRRSSPSWATAPRRSPISGPAA